VPAPTVRGCTDRSHRGRRHQTIRPRPGSIAGYSMRMPDAARAMTSCWICSVPSKMS
jgi:hypothetical protein